MLLNFFKQFRKKHTIKQVFFVYKKKNFFLKQQQTIPTFLLKLRVARSLWGMVRASVNLERERERELIVLGDYACDLEEGIALIIV